MRTRGDPGTCRSALHSLPVELALAVIAVITLDAGTRSAAAYTIESPLTPACHEPITSRALRMVRAELATAAPLETTADDRTLVDDVQFTPDKDMRDLGGVTLLVSARDNDLKGLSSDDFSYLGEVHGDARTQNEHCLRGADDKEPGGSAAAVSACRAFIRARVEEALDGLDANGRPDLGTRTPMRLELSLRGNVEAPLPTYYLRIGQALHAVQDSFAHTYRTPDSTRITVVLNWVNVAKGTLDESRDGPPHVDQLDVCNDPDDLRRRRRELATEASVEILRATLDPLKSRAGKMAAVDAALEKHLSFAPGCTFDNNWCDAAERVYTDDIGCGCTTTSGSAAGDVILLVALFTMLAVRGRAGEARWWGGRSVGRRSHDARAGFDRNDR